MNSYHWAQWQKGGTKVAPIEGGIMVLRSIEPGSDPEPSVAVFFAFSKKPDEEI